MGPVSKFMEKHYLHFNAAAMMDAAKGYVTHMNEGGKMMVTLAGAMSTAELGISLAEMIRNDKVSIISPATGRHVDLEAFGPTNAGVFVRLLNLQRRNG